jgi:hypothetical protein
MMVKTLNSNNEIKTSDVYNIKNHPNTLYMSPSQYSQGLQAITSGQYYPVELCKQNIKRLLVEKGNLHSENQRLVTNCSRFLKFLFDKHCRDYDNTPFINLDSRILKEKLGKNPDRTPNYYKYVLDSCVEIGLLQINHNHKRSQNNSGEAKGYRLTLKEPGNYCLNDTEELFVGLDWSIDNDSYHGQILKLQFDELRFVLIANLLPFDQKNRAFYIYHNWLANNHFVKVDGYGRIHSLLTLMDKRFRHCFKAPGNRIIKEVDMHACQPFLLLKIIQKQLNNRQKIKYTISELASKHQEINTYINWIQSGRFYVELYKVYHNQNKDPKNLNKIDGFKETLFKNIFFSETPDEAKKRKIHRVFQDTFPLINECIIKYKKKHGYKELSRTLQTYESEIMDETIRILNEVHPEGYFIRFHDAILTTELHASHAQEQLNLTVRSHYGINPCIKPPSDWGKDFETVLNGLKLHYLTTHFKNMGIKQNNKRRANEIKKATARATKDDRELAIALVNKKFATDTFMQHQQQLTEVQFKFQGFFIPAHWNESTIINFKDLANKAIDDTIKLANQQSKGEHLWLIDHNTKVLKDALAKL